MDFYYRNKIKTKHLFKIVVLRTGTLNFFFLKIDCMMLVPLNEDKIVGFAFFDNF